MPKNAEPRTLLENATFMLAGNIIQAILSGTASVLIVRGLGPERYGKYTLILTIGSMLAVLWSFGLDVLVVQHVSRDKSLVEKYTNDAILAKSLLMALVLGCYLAASVFFSKSLPLEAPLLVFLLAQYLLSINGIFVSIFSGFRRMGYIAIGRIFRSVLFFGFIVSGIRIFPTVLFVFVAHLLATGLLLIFSVAIAYRCFLEPRFQINLKSMFSVIRKGLPFILINLSYLFFFKIDHIMLYIMSGKRELGLYGAAYTILELIISFIPMIIMQTSFPILSEYHKQDSKDFHTMFNFLLKTLAFLGLPICCGLVLLNKEILVNLYGRDYLGASPAMRFLGLTVLLSFLSSLTSWTLTAIDRQNWVLLSLFVSLCSNVGINLILIPQSGAVGAAVATFISETILLSLLSVKVLKKVYLRFDSALVKMIAASGAMSIFILTAKNQPIFAIGLIGLFSLIAASGAIYVGIVSCLKAYSIHELRYGLLR